MSKRFTDTDKWKDPWFRRLSPNEKAIWQFLTDNADIAGFWKVDMDYLQFHVGVCNCPNSYPESEMLLKKFNEGKERVRNHGEHWELLDFVSFQYGRLSNDCRPHKPVIVLLEKYRKKGYQKGINTLEEQEQDKEQEKEKEIKKRLQGQFAIFWKVYPRKRGKKQAERAYLKIKPNEQLHNEMIESLERAKTSEDWMKQGGKFIPYPATWLNGERWLDEYNSTEVQESVPKKTQQRRARIERELQEIEHDEDGIRSGSDDLQRGIPQL